MPFDAIPRINISCAAADFDLACLRLRNCLNTAERQHALPGALRDCNDLLATLMNRCAEADPAIGAALIRNVRSTHDLHPLEQAA